MTDAWPKTASADITGLITDLRNIGKPAGNGSEKDNVTIARTPYSLQDIKSGASALTKVWAILVAAAGGGPALWALVKGITANVTAATANQASVRVAFVLGGAGLLAAVAFCIAIIVRGDVAARATAHAARASAEGAIITATLTNYRYAHSGWIVQKTDGTYLAIANFNFTNDDGLIITTATGDILQPSQYDAIINANELSPS